MVYYRQHPYMPPDSGYISYEHIKSNIVDELTITSGKGVKCLGYAWGWGGDVEASI